MFLNCMKSLYGPKQSLWLKRWTTLFKDLKSRRDVFGMSNIEGCKKRFTKNQKIHRGENFEKAFCQFVGFL